MDWIGWIKGPVGAAVQWFEAHSGTASWLEAVGKIIVLLAFVVAIGAIIVKVYEWRQDVLYGPYIARRSERNR